MTRHIVERAAQAIFTVFIVCTLSFGLIRLLPGGPMDSIRAKMMQSRSGSMSMSQVNRLVEVYTNVQPQKPIYIQYVDYMSSLLTGNLGKSIFYNGESVSSIIAAALPWTVFIMAISLLLTFTIGISLGAVMGYLEGSRFDSVATMISTLFNSIPYYIAAVVLVYVLGYQLSWFPTGGRVSSDVAPGTLPFFQSALFHAALPIFSLVLTGFGVQALSMRGNSIRILGEDYLRVARLRGLSTRQIALRYVGRNAILPMYTGLMISIGFMFGGSVILEQIFKYQGVGYYMYAAIDSRDYSLMLGAFLIITIAVVLGIFIADMTYEKVDPRAGTGGGNRESY
ncbi:ABC transporter permease [Haladaptatus sp. R4]|uniref:ABC transporter permease n=1 Tax=Haladaptatus sp. R4 TaxID=1679489 RepID=UPI0007B4D684|nr:ABC transporter permease [Haladaptatus sp. R4]KZN23123.1 ABC transporter permease [Haladaptatus sp. R4]